MFSLGPGLGKRWRGGDRTRGTASWHRHVHRPAACRRHSAPVSENQLFPGHRGKRWAYGGEEDRLSPRLSRRKSLRGLVGLSHLFISPVNKPRVFSRQQSSFVITALYANIVYVFYSFKAQLTYEQSVHVFRVQLMQFYSAHLLSPAHRRAQLLVPEAPWWPSQCALPSSQHHSDFLHHPLISPVTEVCI